MLIRSIYGLPVGGICARFRSGHWSTRGDVVIYASSQLQYYSNEVETIRESFAQLLRATNHFLALTDVWKKKFFFNVDLYF